jgi:N-acetyl-gamma-glutamylphosphate reductase
VTVQAPAKRAVKTPELIGALSEFYSGKPFIRVNPDMPRVKDVAASNYAFLSGAANGNAVVVTCVIDNLVKGAAGGAMQWLNRQLGLPETAGLTAPAAGWT